jgi:O-antigen/teichoic acid export membrane protein
MLPILTNYLSLEEYGEVSMFIALMNFIMSIFGLSLDGAFMRKYYDNNDETFRKVKFNYLILLTASFTICLVIVISLKDPLSFYSGVSEKYLIPAIVCSLFSTICYCVNSYHQVKGKAFQYALFTNSWSFLNALLSIILVVSLGLGVKGRILGITLSSVLLGIIGLFILLRSGVSFKLDKSIINEELMVFGIPLLPMNLRGTILNFSDKIFIANIIGLSAAGVYTVSNQLAMIVDVFVRSIALAYTPWLYSKLKENTLQSNKKIVKLTYLLFLIIIIISIIWVVAATLCFPFFIRSDYSDALGYLNWLVLGNAFLGFQLLLVSFIYFSKETKVYAWISIASIVINIFLNYFLIKHYGPIGAAISTCLVYVIMFTLTFILVFHKFRNMPWTLK